MNRRIPKPTLLKAILRVNFTPEFKFVKRILDASETLSEYPDWQTDGIGMTILRDFANMCHFAISPSHVAYEQDFGTDTLFHERTENIIKPLEVLGTRNAIRFGLRKQMMLPSELSYVDLVKITSVKLLSQNSDLRRFLPETMKDMLYRVDCDDEDIRFHINVAPTYHQQLIQLAPFNQNHNLDNSDPFAAAIKFKEILLKYPERSLFIDIDAFQDKPENGTLYIEKLLAFRDQAETRIASLSQDFCNYLFATQIRGEL